jgi:23S rRNA (adenine1618-N6)-methyltransferase
MPRHPQPPADRRSAPRNGVHARLHPRNRHQGRYDFRDLTAHRPELLDYMISTPDGTQTIDFDNPAAVRELNRALLQSQYGLRHWTFPDGYLCPPIPGRADYVHHLADLLAGSNDGQIPYGPAVRGLDIGTGASCIYPLLAHGEYRWTFVGSEVDEAAIASARTIIDSNPGLAESIQLRRQHDRGRIFAGLLREGEQFDITLCNPPFHASADEAARATKRKLQNLGIDSQARNFGGQPTELWCTGGEASFLRRMIKESATIGTRVFWFSSLVSRANTLPELHKHLEKSRALDVRVFDMAQGNKQSRFLAWTFLDEEERAAWRRTRWANKLTAG